MNPQLIYDRLQRVYSRPGKKLTWSACSLCDYPLSFFWSGPTLYFDAGCNCLRQKLIEKIEPKVLLDKISKNPHFFERFMNEQHQLLC